MHSPYDPFITVPLASSLSSSLEPLAQEAIESLLHEGEALNTRRGYLSAMRYWLAWHELRFGQPLQLPLTVDTVLQFIVDHTEHQTSTGRLVNAMPPSMIDDLIATGRRLKKGVMAYNTLTHRLGALSNAHQVHALPNPCQDKVVRELLSRIRKAYTRRGALAQKKDALTKDVLGQLLATCDDSLYGLRDKALLLFAWSSGGRRRSEVAAADMRYLRAVGPEQYIYTLVHSKTNQLGIDAPENHKPIIGQAGQALRAWLDAAQIHEGPIFRRIRGRRATDPLHPGTVRDIVKKRCEQAGVTGNFSAHSLRSGFVTEAADKTSRCPMPWQ